MVAIGNGIGVSFLKGGGGGAPANPDFISIWDTTKAGSASDTVVLPLVSGGVYSGTIDWGDGNTSALSYANRQHTYASGGVYTITISGTIEGWGFLGTGDCLKIIEISNWGTLSPSTGSLSSGGNFLGCRNLYITALDSPIIAPNTYLSSAFRELPAQNVDFTNWENTSNIVLMNNTFRSSAIVPDISTWHIENVSSGFYMFRGGNVGFGQSLYEQTLISWEARLQSLYPNGSGYTLTPIWSFGAASVYSSGSDAETARTSLVINYGWTITDGGAV